MGENSEKSIYILFFLIFAFVFPLFVLSASAQSLDESGNKNKEQTDR